MRKELNKYLRARYPVLLHQVDEEGRALYVAEVPDLPGCMSHGKNANEALKNVEGAKRLWIRSRLEDGQPIPQPTETVDFSGKFVLRTPKALHRQLVQQATQNGVSLNQYAVARLEESTAVDQIRMELQREFAELKVQVEGLRRDNAHLAMLVSQFVFIRRITYTEATYVTQGQPEALDQRFFDVNPSPQRIEPTFASNAAPHQFLPSAEIRR